MKRSTTPPPREQKLLADMRKLLAADLVAEAEGLRRKVKELERQRDKWRGIAVEYKGHTTKYQKELAEARSMLRKNHA